MAIYAAISGHAFKLLLKEEHKQGYNDAVFEMPIESLQYIKVKTARS